jgi:hypothetical protein
MTPQQHADALYGLAYHAEAEGNPERAATMRDAARDLLQLEQHLYRAMVLLETEIATCEMLLNDGEQAQP